MNAIQGYLEKLGSNFMIAAFIPSLVFVAAGTVAFSPLLSIDLMERVRSSLSPLDDNGLIILLVAIMMGFILTSLNTYIYKLFEGYFLTGLLKPFHRIELKRARKIRNRRDFLNNKIGRLENWQKGWAKAKLPAYQKKKLERINNRIEQLMIQRDALASEYDLKYPPTDALIMPTRLGNILRAAEAYPQSRYYADSVALWPRMVWAIDKEYMSHVDAANDQCSFLLNSSLLSAIFAVMSFVAAGYELAKNVSALPLIYLLLGIVALCIAWFFYTASLLNVAKYGNLIRSSYDLFRFNLLEKLHLKLPTDSEKEKELWEQLSRFVTVGTVFDANNFTYPSHFDKEDAEDAELRSILESMDR
jgi:Ca2+/Na+ antiporter